LSGCLFHLVDVQHGFWLNKQRRREGTENFLGISMVVSQEISDFGFG